MVGVAPGRHSNWGIMVTRDSLIRRVAKIVDPTAYVVTPAMYGLKTEKEMRDRTLAGAAQRIAEDRARRVIRLVRSALKNKVQEE